jgi:hypothetical protein
VVGYGESPNTPATDALPFPASSAAAAGPPRDPVALERGEGRDGERGGVRMLPTIFNSFKLICGSHKIYYFSDRIAM